MKRVLIICNTYFQLIVAIQIKLTIKKDESVSIMLTNQSNSAYQIYELLQKDSHFDNVYYLKSKECGFTKNHKPNYLYYLCGGVFGYCLGGLNDVDAFDEFLSFNFDFPSHFVYALLMKRNPKMQCNRFEEGLLSYATDFDHTGLLSLVYKIRNFLGMTNMRSEAKLFYCFNPVAYGGPLIPVEIPKISEQDELLKNILTNLFLYGKDIEPYKEKYIFLPCIYDFEGDEPIGELVLAKRIAEIVGKDNLIVKVHPRDDPARFEELDLHIDKNSAIPWEAIQINRDFSDKIFLTTLSGSILTMNAIFKQPPKSFFLYPFCNIQKNRLALHYSKVVNYYLKNNSWIGLKNICVCEQLTDILKK